MTRKGKGQGGGGASLWRLPQERGGSLSRGERRSKSSSVDVLKLDETSWCRVAGASRGEGGEAVESDQCIIEKRSLCTDRKRGLLGLSLSRPERRRGSEMRAGPPQALLGGLEAVPCDTMEGSCAGTPCEECPDTLVCEGDCKHEWHATEGIWWSLSRLVPIASSVQRGRWSDSLLIVGCGRA